MLPPTPNLQAQALQGSPAVADYQNRSGWGISDAAPSLEFMQLCLQGEEGREGLVTAGPLFLLTVGQEGPEDIRLTALGAGGDDDYGKPHR